MIGWILKGLAGGAGPWILLGLALTFGGLASWGTVQTYRLDVRTLERDKYKGEVNGALEAIHGKDETIGKLQGSLTLWQTIANDNARKAGEAAVRAAIAAADLAAERTKLRQAERADDAMPDCEALLSIDLAAVCPARARGVRERARNHLPGAADRRADPVREDARSPPDH